MSLIQAPLAERPEFRSRQSRDDVRLELLARRPNEALFEAESRLQRARELQVAARDAGRFEDAAYFAAKATRINGDAAFYRTLLRRTTPRESFTALADEQLERALAQRTHDNALARDVLLEDAARRLLEARGDEALGITNAVRARDNFERARQLAAQKLVEDAARVRVEALRQARLEQEAARPVV